MEEWRGRRGGRRSRKEDGGKFTIIVLSVAMRCSSVDVSCHNFPRIGRAFSCEVQGNA